MDELFTQKRHHPPQNFQFNRRDLNESGVVGQIVISILNCKAPGEKCYRERDGPRGCIFQINKEAWGPSYLSWYARYQERRSLQEAGSHGGNAGSLTQSVHNLAVQITYWFNRPCSSLLLRLLFNPISAVCKPGHRCADVPLVIWLRIIFIRSQANLAFVYSWLIWFIQILQIIELWYLATYMLELKVNYKQNIFFLDMKS